MFCHLKPWQSWQVVVLYVCQGIQTKSIWWNFKFKFWFKTFESEYLGCQTKINFAKDYQKDSYNKNTFDWKKIKG
jgi:hypothetical protein